VNQPRRTAGLRARDRREVLGLLAAAAAARAAAARAASPPISVNLSELPPDSADTTSVASGLDLVRRMAVPVSVNDQGPFEFVVDTGANRSVIAYELSQALALPSAGPAKMHGIAGVETTPTVHVKRLRVGTIESGRLRLPVLGQDRMGAQGLLGVDVLRNRRVVMNFREQRLDISPSSDPLYSSTSSASRIPEGARDPSIVTVPARFRFGQLIIVDATVGETPVVAFLDSGSQNTVANLALREQLLARNPATAAHLANVELLSATGQRAAGQLSPLPPLRLGGLTIGGLTAVFSDLHAFAIWKLLDQPAILIGVDILHHFYSVTLDFGRRLVTFRTPPKPRPATSP